MIPMTSEALRRAAELVDEITAKQNELNQILAGQVSSHLPPSAAVIRTANGRHFSPEAIEKIRAAQRRRWKAVRKAQAAFAAVSSATEPTPVPAPVQTQVTAKKQQVTSPVSA